MKIRLLNDIELLVERAEYTRDVSIRTDKMTSKEHRYYGNNAGIIAQSHASLYTWLGQIVSRDIA